MKNIRQLDYEDLEAYILSINEKKFRAQQVWAWIWKKHIADFSEMSNLSLHLRTQLSANFSLPALKINHTVESNDGTIKNRFITSEGHFVEGVIIPTEDRKTVCVSSQIGCSLSCSFCATGYMDRKRNLEFDEIVDQVVLMNRQTEMKWNQKITNIVFMGMGEPLLNYKNVLQAVEKISSPDSLGMSPKRITVSTAGVAKMIDKLGDDGVRFKLALSLHAPTDEKRNRIMPINETNNIEALKKALNYFYKKTGNEITLEYILFKDFNDSLQDANELVKIYRQVPVDLINIIEYNPIGIGNFSKPTDTITDSFIRYLELQKVNVRLRRSRGKDIQAACGQLANQI